MTQPDETPAHPSARLSRRHVVMGGLFAGVTAISYAREPSKPDKRTPPGTVEALMPVRVGAWSFASASGAILPPPDATANQIYDNIVNRTYTAPGRPPVMLVFAYSNVQDGMLQVHRPEFCYTAAGFTLSPTADVAITDATGVRHGANTFAAVSPERTEQVLYWTRIGKSFPQSWLQQKYSVMESNLEGRTPDGLLARFSLADSEPERGLRILQEFVADLDRAAGPKLQDILFARHV